MVLSPKPQAVVLAWLIKVKPAGEAVFVWVPLPGGRGLKRRGGREYKSNLEELHMGEFR